MHPYEHSHYVCSSHDFRNLGGTYKSPCIYFSMSYKSFYLNFSHSYDLCYCILLKELAHEMAQAFLSEDLPEAVFSAPKAGPGMWASVVRILEPSEGRTDKLVRLEQNEAATSLALVKFANQSDGQLFLIVGVAKDMHLNPRNCQAGFLYTYK